MVAKNMREYVNALTIIIITCFVLGKFATTIIIPMLCLCLCLARFCYVTRQKKEPEKLKCSREIHRAVSYARLSNSVSNTKSESGTPQHFMTDSTIIDMSRSERQIAKGQLGRSQCGGELKSKYISVTGSTSEQDDRL
ncbi:unnamed protein product [Cercopithifilaria johnstoni]|uniref:Uncharacterized protein n=1 Tax=Cercopithifilaria johnstoni TaxID=2874296 RepID=A0A8J2LZ43_9BILA|nr:unnamed protein product [Cercopithifilaria johnstoni]